MDIKKICGDIADLVLTIISAICVTVITMYILVDTICLIVLIFNMVF